MPVYRTNPSGDILFVNSEVGPDAVTVLFPDPETVANNYRVSLANTSTIFPSTPITHDFNGASYLSPDLEPTSGTTIDIRMSGEIWDWVYNDGGEGSPFWYPIKGASIHTRGGLYEKPAGDQPIVAPSAIQLTEVIPDMFFDVSGSVLTATRSGRLRIDLYAVYESTIANNEDAGILIDTVATAGTPSIGVPAIGQIFQSSRGGVYVQSTTVFGVVSFNAADAFQFVADVYTGQAGLTSLLDFSAVFTTS